MLAEHRFFQGVRALQHDGVVMGGVHLRIAHGDILTTVDVDAVAVGIYHHIIDCADLTTRDDNGEMPTPKDGDITDGDVPTLFQGDGLVAGADGSALYVTGPLGVMACQSLTVYHPITADADVLLSFSPDQRIMEIGMSSILIFGCAEHLTLIVGLHLCRCRQDLGSRHQVQVDMTLQSDTATEIHALRQKNLSAALLGCGLDGLVDGDMVKCLAVTLGTIVLHVIHRRGHGAHRDGQDQQQYNSFHSLFNRFTDCKNNDFPSIINGLSVK